jgi:hypothetical protein
MIHLHYPDGRGVDLDECVVTFFEPARTGGTLIWTGSEEDSLAIHVREEYEDVHKVIMKP